MCVLLAGLNLLVCVRVCVYMCAGMRVTSRYVHIRFASCENAFHRLGGSSAVDAHAMSDQLSLKSYCCLHFATCAAKESWQCLQNV